MPKEYKERRIDIEPPKFRARHNLRTTTAVDPEETLPPGTYSTPVSLTPGDGVLWFLRLDNADSAPSGRMVSIVSSTGGTVSHTYVTEPSGFANYIDLFNGDFLFDNAGIETVTNDYIYVIWDQFDSFTAGSYRLKWAPPETTRANVEGAILLSGVDTTAQGNYYYGPGQSPTWIKYEAASPYDHFPISVPTANHSIVYGFWDMSGGVEPPAGYTSVPGTQHLAYTYTDPSVPETMTQTIITRAGVATGSTLSVASPTTGTYAGFSTSYRFSAVVLHSATGITYTTVTFEA